ncbi:DEAD/DEAH box helicase [Streptomyces sp. NBC_01310]|uniref:UvrD-helicase domain-containing protein n=1 Tax=Streptomyces sp. NBC_01310 TaxID=2903820 RepID=UPI0035B60F3E|nr:DEAD/DEAH box helicase [Streptomyces sp. NBC_01310]
MPQLALSASFWEEYEQLEKPVRAGVRKAMAKFQKLTAAELHADKGLHLESVENARDPRMRTIRITAYWRGVVLAPDDGGSTFLLVNVVQHDRAYGWAAKRLFSVNSATRGLEVRNVEAIEQIVPLLEQVAEQAPRRLFDEHSDTVLRHLGIDDALLPAVRSLTDKAQLEAFIPVFPEDQCEVLLYLAEGATPEEVWTVIVSQRRPADDVPLDLRDVSAAIANTTSRIVVVSRPDDLERMLTEPFAAWRVFLHPSQRRIAYRESYSGPVQVTGGPGTGKTVVALHRVKHLLASAEQASSPPVLLTTYTTALASILRENLAVLLDDPAALAQVQVGTVNSLAAKVLREHAGRVPAAIDDHDERARWRGIAKQLGLPWTGEFLMQEYRHVILAQDIRTEAEYVAADRRGRGSSLPPARRPLVWRAVSDFVQQLDAEGRSTHLLLCAEAARVLRERSQGPGLYRHLVVDEAQDLHPAQWRLLRAAVPEGPDDIFLTGDPHQRIYDSRVSFAALGIAVVGRSFRLRVNYRNTEEILRWSRGVLSGQTVEDLSGDGADGGLAGYVSLLHGARPGVLGHLSEEAELTGLVECVRQWLAMDVSAAEIAVCTRFHQLGAKAQGRLRAAGIEAVLLRDAPGPDAPGVRIATMHAMKGLEFRCVVVLGATQSTLPLLTAVTPAAADPVQHAADMLAERCLLFVACTRAREGLSVSWSGAPSPFLAGLNGSAGADQA